MWDKGAPLLLPQARTRPDGDPKAAGISDRTATMEREGKDGEDPGKERTVNSNLAFSGTQEDCALTKSKRPGPRSSPKLPKLPSPERVRSMEGLGITDEEWHSHRQQVTYLSLGLNTDGVPYFASFKQLRVNRDCITARPFIRVSLTVGRPRCAPRSGRSGRSAHPFELQRSLGPGHCRSRRS